MPTILAFLACVTFSVCIPAGQIPNDKLTPGVIDLQVTKGQVCTPGFSVTRRHTTDAMKRAAFDEYRIPLAKRDWVDKQGKRHSFYEIDHRIPLELGGADTLKNLWPQRYTGPHNAYIKDVLEDAIKRDVCAGRVSLQAGQAIFFGNWIEAMGDR